MFSAHPVPAIVALAPFSLTYVTVVTRPPRNDSMPGTFSKHYFAVTWTNSEATTKRPMWPVSLAHLEKAWPSPVPQTCLQTFGSWTLKRRSRLRQVPCTPLPVTCLKLAWCWLLWLPGPVPAGPAAASVAPGGSLGPELEAHTGPLALGPDFLPSTGPALPGPRHQRQSLLPETPHLQDPEGKRVRVL